MVNLAVSCFKDFLYVYQNTLTFDNKSREHVTYLTTSKHHHYMKQPTSNNQSSVATLGFFDTKIKEILLY